MTHEPVELLISRLLDGDLADDEARALRERIAKDPEAGRLYRQMEATVLWTRTLGEERAPTSLIVGLREAIAREPWWRRWADRAFGAPILTPARGLAFVLVAAVVVGVVWTVPQWNEAPSPATGEVAVLTPPAKVMPFPVESVAKETIPAAPVPAAPVAGPGATTPAVPTDGLAMGGAAVDVVRSETVAGDRARREPAAESDDVAPRATIAGTAARAVPLTVSPAPPPRVAGAPEPVSPILAQPAAALVVYEPSGGFLSRMDRPVSAGGGIDSFYAEEAADEFLAPAEDQAARRGGAPKAEASAKDKKAEKPADAPKRPVIFFRLVRNAELAPLPKKGMADKAPEAGQAGTIRVDAANVVREFKGSYSGLKVRGTFVIEGRGDWESFWERLAANHRPVPKAPEIDYGADFAVGVAMGEKSSGGFEVTITAIELVGKTLRVTVEERKPAAGMGMTLALSQPYHVLILPRRIGDQTFSTAKGYTVEFVYQ